MTESSQHPCNQMETRCAIRADLQFKAVFQEHMPYISVVSLVIRKNSNDDGNDSCTVKSRIDLSFAKKKKKAENLFKDISVV